MRNDKERAMNTPFLLFSIPVGGHEKPFKATALSMCAAVAWCDDAHAWLELFREGMQDRSKFLAVMQAGIEVLRSYSAINQIDRVDWDALTAEQIADSISTLLDVNDPFVRAQSRKAQEEADQLEMLRAIKEMGITGDQIMELTESQKQSVSRTPS